ncbi:DoxX family protein [Leifsonia poae]|uniref:DoxX family protein n=1 Tax=Leifsonia poae TaxID=110933 RepID=UPI001CBF14D1|nr:DoxX family protein [Leifsonia poae]
MAIAVWIVSGILAALYLAAGLMKSLRPKAALAPSLPWVDDYSAASVKAIGIVEVLGAIGLILPWLTGIAAMLTPIAASGFVIVQVLAIVVHMRRHENKSLPLNIILLLAALFVAIARFAGA